MAYSQLGVIEATDYNNFVSTLNSIWGTGSGSYGYGQAGLLSTTVSSAEIVTATQWQNLIARAKTISQHQGLSISGLPTTVSAGDRIDFLSRLSTNMTSMDGARFNGSNGTTVTQSPVPSTISWNLLAPTTLQMVYTATWANADQARYFFNAGGKLRLTLSATDNGPSSKGADWANLINTRLGGTYTISATESTYASFAGPGGSSSTGYWDLTTSDTTLNTLTSTTTGYTNNSITVKAKTNGTQGANGDNGTVVTITVDLSDDGLNPTDAWGDALNLSIANQLDLLPPESGYLTTSITNPTVARSSYAIDTSGTMPAGISFDYYTAGTYSWTVPSGVTSIRVMVVAGGGGGGSSETGGGSCSGDGGGGGGGGEFAAGTLTVTPGHVLSLTVGAGGAGGGVNSPGGIGANSSIINSTTSTTLVTAIRGAGGGEGGNGSDPARGIGGAGGSGGYGHPTYWSGYRFSGGTGGSSNEQRCGGGCCAGYDGGDLGWSSGSIFTERPNGGYAASGAAGLAGWASGGGGGGGASLGDGGRGGNGNGASTDSRSAGLPGAYGSGGGGSCDEVTTGNSRGAGGTGYIYVEYGGASPATTTAQLTLVGGGGGGGNGDNTSGGGGGGGGAGVVTQSLTLAPGNYYGVIIGAGGVGGVSNSSTFPTNGSQSSFGSVVSYGGGGGGRSSYYSNCPTSSLIASTGGGFGRAISACSSTSGQGGTGGTGGGSTAGSTSDAGGGGGGGGSYYNGSSGTAASVNGGNGGDGGAGDNITAATTTMLFGSGSTAGYSAFFGGSAINDYIFINTTSVFNSGSSDFTIEAWIYLMAMPTSDAWPTNFSSHMVIAKVGSPSSSNGFGFLVGQTKLIIHGTSDTQYASSAHGMSALTWYHVAAVRSGNNIYFYVNGVGKGSVAFSESPESVGYTYIGTETDQGAYFYGYMSNLRVVKGTAVYTADFTPSTSALTAISGTSLLVFQSASMVDNSTNNFTLTRPSWNGPTVETFHPANAGASETLMYGAGGGGGSQDGTAGIGGGTNYGYSVYLDGSGDYMSVPYNTATNIRSGDFTVECWFNAQISSGVIVIAAQWQQTTNPSWAITLNHSSSGKVGFFWGLVSEASPLLVGNSYTVNKWHHVAIVRTGNAFHLFQDGIRIASTISILTGSAINVNTTFGINYNSSGTFTGTGLTDYMGYISHFRLVKGTAIYTSNFNPSKNITYVSGTGLLMCKSSTIIETANGFTITTYGSPTVSSFIVGPAGNGGKRGYIGSPGLANSGSGAGGTGVGLSGITGASGGSGVAIISYSGSSAKATGGTIAISGGVVTHKFTSSGAFRMISDPISANVVIVGGGGGGRGNGGPPGGGGGTVTLATYSLLSGQSYTVIVGAGGTADSSGGAAGSGSTSSITGIASSSGGTGGGSANLDRGGNSASVIYGTTTNYTGGTGWYTNNQNTGVGAGAGAGGNGETVPSGQNRGGTGGIGYYASDFLIAGTDVNNTATTIGTPSGGYYGGGGGGGYPGADYGSFSNGLGGAGGGGGKPVKTNTGYPTYGQDGLTNTGGGGQGGSWPNGGAGGAGGSGVVIIRYEGALLATGGTVTQSNGYTYHVFTVSSTFSVF